MDNGLPTNTQNGLVTVKSELNESVVEFNDPPIANSSFFMCIHNSI
jgi:hypothetical protein